MCTAENLGHFSSYPSPLGLVLEKASFLGLFNLTLPDFPTKAGIETEPEDSLQGLCLGM